MGKKERQLIRVVGADAALSKTHCANLLAGYAARYAFKVQRPMSISGLPGKWSTEYGVHATEYLPTICFQRARNNIELTIEILPVAHG